MRVPFAVLLSLLAVTAAADEAWKVIQPAGLGFSIEFPVVPHVKDEEVDLGDKRMAKTKTLQIINDNTIFDVTVSDYPKGMIAEAGGEAQVLDNARDGGLANAPGPLKSETRIEYAGRQARELLVDMSMGMTLRSRIFIVDDRLYNVGIIARDGTERKPAAEKFFASFKLTGAPNAAR